MPDQDRPNAGVFSFQDDDEQWLSLRYDLTAPLARYVAENFDQLPKPYRSYHVGWVFRNEKPGPGRFRQFLQFDADTVGSSSPAADAEICMMAADVMEALGIARGSYLVKLNNRKVLDGLLETIGLGRAGNETQKLTVLRAMDKYDRLGVAGVEQLLGRGRRDESGDFTEGAGLSAAAIRTVLGVFEPVADSDEKIAQIDLRMQDSEIGQDGRQELEQIDALVKAAGYANDRIVIDPSVVRGLEYYTGPVYEVELTFPIESEDGKPARFGSVAGGGRYDGLVARFRGRAGAGNGVLDRRLAPDRGAAPSRQDRDAARARTGGGDGVRPATHRRLPETWSCACAMPASAPSFISARAKWGRSSNMPTGVARLAWSSKVVTKRPRAKCRSRI